MRFVIFISVFILSTLSLVFTKERNDKPYKVVCYFESWGDYDKGEDRFVAEDVNPQVCTHLNYAFASLVNNSIQLEDPKVDGSANGGHDMIHRLVALRKHNPNLTVMISLGGWSEGSTKYSEMARTAASRKEFVDSVVEFLQKYDLDGIDMDWEYPGFSAVADGERKLGFAGDKQNYVHLLQEMQQAFKSHSYLISAAVAGAKGQIDVAYDIASLSKYLDFINLMTYAYHGGWDGFTGHDAPLSAPSEEEHNLNVQFTVDYWIKLGADPKKLIVGIPLYGTGYHLTGTDAKLGAKAIASNEGGTYSKLCQQFKQPDWQVHWDQKAQVPYAVNGSTWISFENLQSVQKKVDYVLEKKLGGSMVWALNGDDFHGHCGDGKFPLMKAQMKTLNKVDVQDVKL